jgi:PAS domain S-box-containing protein
MKKNKKDCPKRLELQTAWEQFCRWFDMSSHPLVILDKSGLVLDANPKTAEWLGKSKRSVVDKPFNRHIHEKDRDLFRRHLAGAFRKKTRQVCELRLKGKKGGHRFVQMDSVVTKDSRLRRNICRTAVTDITPYKTSEAMYRGFFDLASVGIFQTTLGGKILFLNDAAVRMLGLESFEKLQSKNAELFHMDRKNRAAFVEQLKKAGKAESYEIPIKSKGGELVYCLINAYLEDQVITGVVQDITGRKAAEQALEISEKKYRVLIEQSPQGFLVIQKNRIVFANPAMVEILGYEIHELIALPPGRVKNLLHPDDRARVWETLQKRMAGEDVPSNYECRVLRKDATTRWVEIFASIIRYRDQPATQAFAVDITERKKTEAALRQSEEKYRLVSENIPVVVYSALPDGKSTPLMISGKIAELTGYTKEEFLSDPQLFSRVVYPEDRDYVWAKIKEHRHEKVPLDIEYRIVTKDGKVKWLRDKATPVLDERKRIVRIDGFSEDITLAKQMLEELQKSKTLESLGHLAGGIAHDFNNILTGVLGHINMARLSASPGEKVSRHLDRAEKAAWRAKNLTQQLLTFSSGGAPVKKVAAIDEIIRESAGFVTSGSNVSCRYHLPGDLWPVEVDSGQMNQVIHNLVMNADQAMPEGGEIRILGENVLLGKKEGVPLRPGKYVKLSIEDDGTGIPQKHLSKIFNPYFTTKQKGRGLGLTTVYHIVKKHGGHIEVTSQERHGAAFHLYLPASRTKLPRQKKRRLEDFSGSGLILILDDDDVVREVIENMLADLGYDTVVAKNSLEAVSAMKKAHKSEHPFDAVILDLTVPGDRSGQETLKALRKIDPGVPSIVSSGYSNDPVMAEYKKHGFDGVLVKPYKTRHLGDVLKQVLKRKSR